MRPEIDNTLMLIDAANGLVDSADRRERYAARAVDFVWLWSDEVLTARISQGERLVERMRIGRTAFLRAGEQLQTVRGWLDGMTLETIPVEYLFYLNQLNTYYDLLAQTNEVLLNSPELLTAAFGLGDQQDYLILSQNSDELRPSGGYISTYGWLSVRNGRIVDYGYSPTTAHQPESAARQRGDVRLRAGLVDRLQLADLCGVGWQLVRRFPDDRANGAVVLRHWQQSARSR